MRTRSLITALIIWLAFTLHASSWSFSSGYSMNNAGELPPCDIPAPGNFHSFAIGPTYVDLAWNHEPSSYGYRVRAFRTSDGVLVRTNIVVNAASATTRMDSLEFGVEHRFVINSICNGGGHSNREADITRGTLILELVVIGQAPPSNGESCIRTTSGSCTFSNVINEVTGFKIRSGGQSRTFGIKPYLNNQEIRYSIQLENNNQNQHYKIRCAPGYNGPEPNCSSPSYQIFYSKLGMDVLTATFTLENQTTTGMLHYTVISGGSEFLRMAPPPQGFTPAPPTDPNTIERDETGAEFRQSAAVAPNPFSDQLDVYLAFPNKTVANVQLVNLGGQIVVNELLQAGQEKFSLPTAHIAAGFYLLRVEADGVKQTFKVVKTE